MSEESPRSFPWYGYLEPYAFGASAIGFLGLALANIMGLKGGALVVVSVLSALPALILPAVVIYAFERARRAVARAWLGERAPDVENERDLAERDLAITQRRLLAYAIRRVRDVSYEEALGSFMPIRVLITIFMVMSILILFTIVVMQPRGVSPIASHFFLLVLFGFGALVTFCGNLALSYLWRGGVQATTHIVEGQRALIERRKVLAGTDLGGAISLEEPAQHKGELSMARAGELSEYVEATRHDEDVALGLDADQVSDQVGEELYEELGEELEVPGTY